MSNARSAGPQLPPLVIPARFCGPPSSGNGGWTCGALAARLAPGGAAVTVRLFAPPPLERALTVQLDDDQSGLSAWAGEQLVARARPTSGEGNGPVPGAVPLDPAPFEAAVQAGDRYPGLTGHPFPTCFSCGTERAPGDGLRLRPGPWHGGTAAAWIPDPSLDAGDGAVDLPVTWAALDCPGGWAVDLAGRPMVLGTMAARVARRPRIGEHCVVRGTVVAERGRTAHTATTLFGAEAQMIAAAAHVWVVVDPARFTPGSD